MNGDYIVGVRRAEEGVDVTFAPSVTAEELTALLTATMAKVAELPDFDPLAFQGQLMAAMTQGVGG